MDPGRINEANKLMQEADKAATKTLFRKPDWDIAGQTYEQAATTYKVAGAYEQATQAYSRASDAMFKTNSLYMAARALENAGQVFQQNLKQPERAADAYQRASRLYHTQGSPDRAAEMMDKAGRVLEPVNIHHALEAYKACVTIYEQEDRGRFAQEVYKRAIRLLIQSQQYDQAIQMLHRQSQSLQKMANRPALHRADLSVIILCLKIGDAVEANKQFQEFLGRDPGFGATEEAGTAQGLLDGFEQNDQELVEEMTARRLITDLDTEIARVAKSLRVPGEMENEFEDDRGFNPPPFQPQPPYGQPPMAPQHQYQQQAPPQTSQQPPAPSAQYPSQQQWTPQPGQAAYPSSQSRMPPQQSPAPYQPSYPSQQPRLPQEQSPQRPPQQYQQPQSQPAAQQRMPPQSIPQRVPPPRGASVQQPTLYKPVDSPTLGEQRSLSQERQPAYQPHHQEENPYTVLPQQQHPPKEEEYQFERLADKYNIVDHYLEDDDNLL